jgi:hypothetical protein
MIQLKFTAEDIAALHYERFHHPHPRVQRKMEAVYIITSDTNSRSICSANLSLA